MVSSYNSKMGGTSREDFVVFSSGRHFHDSNGNENIKEVKMIIRLLRSLKVAKMNMIFLTNVEVRKGYSNNGIMITHKVIKNLDPQKNRVKRNNMNIMEQNLAN